MANSKYGRFGGLLVGFAVGLALGGLWPQTPLHAVSTDRAQNVVMATGLVDNQVEAVFYLNTLTGMLSGFVPDWGAKAAPPQSAWAANVAANMEAARRQLGIQTPSEPRYVMVTGMIDAKQTSGQVRAGKSLVYVADVNSGLILVYMVPWSPNMHESHKQYQGQLALWAVFPVATGAVRERE